MKALLEASKKAGKPKKAKPPVMTEGTGNPSDPKDWTNAPGNKTFADQLKKVNGGR
jgi:primase-polymerase (primpol)-like protein